MKSSDTVQSVERAIELLYCFSPIEPELALNDFVKKTGLNRTTVFRLLTSLRNKNLIIKDETAGTYKLGLPFMGFAQIVTDNLNIRKAALPVMRTLAEKTNETISLNLIQDLNRICVEKVESTADIRQLIHLGSPYPILKGASGKLLLAYSSPDLIQKVLEEEGNDDLNKDELLIELQNIKEKGYAFSMNERVIGAYAISAPIIGYNSQLIGGLSISGLSARLNKQNQKIYIEEVLSAAHILSIEMGYESEKMTR